MKVTIPISARVLATLVLFAPAAVRSQIVGTVQDNFGRPVSGAVVAIVGSQFSAATSADGKFSLDFVPGEFVVSVTAPGHANDKIPLKLFSKDRFPVAPVTLVLLPPEDGFRIALADGYALVPAKALSSRQRKVGQFMPPCTDLLPGNPPIASGTSFVAFSPQSQGAPWVLARASSNGIPGMPGGLVTESDCGPLGEMAVTWTRVGDGQWMLTGNLADGVYCLGRRQTLGGMMRYIEKDAACFTWRKAQASATPTATNGVLPDGAAGRPAAQDSNGVSALPPNNGVADGSSAKPFDSGSVWKGSYVCGQGLTELTLKIESVEGVRVSGTFDFYDPKTSVRGSYRISGDYDSSRSAITFKPGDWIQRPSGFTTVGLSGTVSKDGSRFSGKIDHTSCSEFSTTKVALPKLADRPQQSASALPAASAQPSPEECNAAIEHVLKLVDDIGRAKNGLGTQQFMRQRQEAQKNLADGCAKGLFDVACLQRAGKWEAIGECVPVGKQQATAARADSGTTGGMPGDAKTVAQDPAWQATWKTFSAAFRNNKPDMLIGLASYPLTCGEKQELTVSDEASLRKKLTATGGCLPFSRFESLGEQGNDSLNNLAIDKKTGRPTIAITMGTGVDCSTWIWAHFDREDARYVLRRLWSTRACTGD